MTRDHRSRSTGAATFLWGPGVSRSTNEPIGATARPRDSGRWRYRPRPLPERRGEEREAFRSRLAGAIAVGRGLGVALSLRLEAGVEPVLSLRGSGSDLERWVERVLAPAYGAQRWARTSAPTRGHARSTWYGRRGREWPVPLVGTGEAGALLDLFALALSSVRSTIALEVSMRPVPMAPARWWEVVTGSGVRVGPLPPAAAPRGRAAPSASRLVDAPAPAAPPFWTVRIGLEDANDRGGDGPAIAAAARALEQTSRASGGGGFRFRRWARWSSWLGERAWVSEQELVALFPGADGPATGGDRGNVFAAERVPLGRTRVGEVVGVPLDPTQGRHLVVLGETGMGKSSMLVALARWAAARYGVVLLDPLGETADAFEAELGTAERARTVRVSPKHPGSAINALGGIEPEAGGDPVRSERRLNDIVYALRRVRAGRYAEPSGFWGPRLEEMLGRALRAAAAWPNGTLEDAHTLLATGARLHREAPPGASGALRELAERIRDRPEDGEGARRLLYEVVRDSTLARMLCARQPELTPRALVEPGRIGIVSGEAATIGELSARYLLSIYLALLWSELLARPGAPKTFVVLDEAQWFGHESLAEMLTLGRRANVHAVLATQSVASLPPLVGRAIWTNAADFVAFRGSPEEARELGRLAGGVSAEAIAGMPRGHAVALLGKGEAVRWLRTLRRPPRAAREPGPGDPPPAVPDGGAGPDPGAPGRGPGTEGPVSRPELATTEPPASVPGLPPRPAQRGAGDVRPPSERGGSPWSRVETVLRCVAGFDEGPTCPSSQRPSTVRVDLDDLRRRFDPEGGAVRDAGSRLGRVGAIVESGRDAHGAYWLVRTDGAARAAHRAVEERSRRGSGAAQLS